MLAYQEVIASKKVSLFTLKIFTEVSLDPIIISLIEECFAVKSVITKIPKTNWLKASNVKFSPVKINKFIVTSSFFAKSVRQDRFSVIIDPSLEF